MTMNEKERLRRLGDGESIQSVCEAAGITVRTIPGERWAFKITHEEDFALAQWLVESGRIRWAEVS